MLVSDCLRANRDEIFQKDGCQHWFKLILNDLGRNHSEAVVLPYRTWPEPCLDPKPEWSDQIEEDVGEYKDYVAIENKARVARRAKRAIRFACKTAEFDRMITLTTKDNFTRDEMEIKASKFIRLLRQASGEVVQYVIVPEIHDSEKTSASKRGSHHLHIAVCGRQNYKLLVKIWHYRICGGRGFVFVTNPFNKHTGKVYSPAQMANYLSKYVSKNISGGGFGKKSYWISQNIAPPVRTVLLFRTYDEALRAAIEHFQALGLSFGTEKHRYWRDEAMNVLWLAAG